MQGKIFGIPLILILLVVFIAGLVDIPMFYMHSAQMKHMNDQDIMLREINSKLDLKPTSIPEITVATTPTPTIKSGIKTTPATPSAIKK